MTRPEITDTSGEGTVCSVDGAVVHVKRREAREDVPAFEYVIGTDEAGPVAVRLRQPLPDDLDPAAVGFPPPCEDDWRLDDSTLVFEAPVEPGEPVRTAWGVDGDAHPPIEPPEIDVAPFDTPGSGDAEAADDASSDHDGGTDAAEAAADGVSAGGSAADDETASLDLSEPPEGLGADGEDSARAGAGAAGTAEEDAGSVPASTSESGAPSLDATAGEPGDTESLVARLVAELESDDLEDEHRRALQDALAVRLSDSTNAFVEHLQAKLERRAEGLSEEIQSLEESVERVYGVKADGSDLDAVKRGLTELDDAKVGQSELDEVRAVAEEAAERSSATAEAVATLRDGHEELAADAASESDLAALEARTAEAERVAELADAVAELREATTTEADLDRLAERIDELGRRHEELAETAAEADELERIRSRHRTKLDSTRSDLTDLRATLEAEYTSDAAIGAELDRRLQRSLGTLVLFGIGSTGLLSTLPLALTGSSSAAAVTFAGGAVALSVWGYLLVRVGDQSGPSAPSTRDVPE